MKKKNDTTATHVQARSKTPNSHQNNLSKLEEKPKTQSPLMNKSEIAIPRKSNDQDMFNQSFGYNDKSNNMTLNLEEKHENNISTTEKTNISKSATKIAQNYFDDEEGSLSNEENQIDQIITNIRIYLVKFEIIFILKRNRLPLIISENLISKISQMKKILRQTKKNILCLLCLKMLIRPFRILRIKTPKMEQKSPIEETFLPKKKIWLKKIVQKSKI